MSSHSRHISIVVVCKRFNVQIDLCVCFGGTGGLGGEGGGCERSRFSRKGSSYGAALRMHLLIRLWRFCRILPGQRFVPPTVLDL